MKYYLGIDIGTSSSKGVLLDASLRLLASMELPHETQNPKPGWFSHNAEDIWWGDFCRLARLLPEQAGIPAAEIACVGLSALSCDCVPVGRDGRALADAILYGIDSRAAEELSWIRSYYGSNAEAVFGHTPCSSDVAPKILWFKNHMPEIHEKAYKFLTASSYLCGRLTGRFVMDPYLAEDFRPLYLPGESLPDPAGCGPYCRPEQLPELLPAVSAAGTVTPEAAAETGLRSGTPVLTGTGDSGAEAISAGVCRPGDLLLQLGSTAYMILLSDRMIQEPRLWPGSFLLPGTCAICAGTNTAGTLIDWLCRQWYPDAENTAAAYRAMVREAEAAPAGSGGLLCLPCFAGERTPINDPEARGCFFGLTLQHTRGQILRAGIEGICYSIRANIELMEAHGLPIRRVLVTGGGTKNAVWLHCLADILGRELLIPAVTLGASYGDALMAAAADGALPDYQALAGHIAISRTIRPEAAHAAVYSRGYSRFTRLYAATSGLMHETAAEEFQIV